MNASLTALVLFVVAANPQSKTIPPRSDPLLGKWVCLANNAEKNPKATMEFRHDGKVVLTDHGKSVTMHYMREPIKKYAARLNDSGLARSSALDVPDGEMIYFADPKDKYYQVGGGRMLTLYPRDRILMNPITQMWCRPGEELQARKVLGFGKKKSE